jgi:hypothetical protein
VVGRCGPISVSDRLDVVEIALPPLRERGDDVLLRRFEQRCVVDAPVLLAREHHCAPRRDKASPSSLSRPSPALNSCFAFASFGY